MDSFVAFEECLQIANSKKVDFVLLGGDLFHDQKPSQKAYLKASEIFNRQVFHTNESGEESMSGRKLQQNYERKLSIYSIHGNHDDPIGLEMISTLDQVQSNHYVTYFGKVVNIEQIEVVPLLFEKGDTKIAIYGIGHMKDERLNLAFEQDRIKFKRPKGEN